VLQIEELGTRAASKKQKRQQDAGVTMPMDNITQNK
jgi:hypothetical protein